MRKAEYLTQDRLIALGEELLDTFELYPHRDCYTEKHLEFALCSLMRRTLSKVIPQARATIGRGNTGQGRRDQIDFRTGTTNRVFVEFAVRRKNKYGHVGGWKAAENRSELIKLTGETSAGTKRRYLLIVDIARQPALAKSALVANYRQVWAALQCRRAAVTVLYIHPDAIQNLRLD